jgi:hypothetical protein
LVSRIDRAADLELTRDEIRGMASADYDDAYATLRHDYLDRVGLLCIYPIAKDSQPRGRKPAKPPATRRGSPWTPPTMSSASVVLPEDNSAQVHPVPRSRPEAQCRSFSRSVSPGRFPNPPCPLLSNGSPI